MVDGMLGGLNNFHQDFLLHSVNGIYCKLCYSVESDSGQNFKKGGNLREHMGRNYGGLKISIIVMTYIQRFLCPRLEKNGASGERGMREFSRRWRDSAVKIRSEKQ